jgi:hypothetical protein
MTLPEGGRGHSPRGRPGRVGVAVAQSVGQYVWPQLIDHFLLCSGNVLIPLPAKINSSTNTDSTRCPSPFRGVEFLGSTNL